MKRFLSLVLCVIMCMSVFTATAGQVYALGDAEKLFTVTNSGFSDDEITYTVKLASGQTKVTGAVVKATFDASALEVKESHAAGYYNADGDFTEYVPGVYETGLSYDEDGVCALAYMSATGYTVGEEDASLFTVTFRAIDDVRRPTSVEFVCTEFITDDGNSDNDIKKSDGIQSICTHEFHTLSMPKVTEVNSVTDGLKVVWGQSVGAQSYTIYRKTSTASAWTLLCSDIGTATEYVDNTVVKGTEYYYTVSASNEYGSTEYDKTGVPGLNFGSIESISAVAVENGAKVTWSALDGATSYEVYRKPAVTSNWQLVNTVTSAEYTDTSILSGVVYNYKVRALKGRYTADISCEPASVKYIAVPQTEISNIYEGIEISLEEVNGAEKYIIEKKTGNGTYSVIAQLLADGDLSFIDEDVAADTEYTYRVQALSSDVSSVKKILPSIVRLGSVSVKTVSNNTAGVYIAWSDVKGAESYVVNRRTADEGVWSVCTETAEKEFIDTDVVSGTEYIYFVTAKNSTGFGGYENTASLLYVATPTISSVSTVSEGIRTVWDAVPGAEKYIVYRAVSGKNNWTEIAQTSELSYVDESAVHGTYYKYAVSAVKNGSQSSRDVNGVDGMYFGTVTTVSAKAVTDGAEITWSALEKAEGYYVYRKAADESGLTLVATVASNKYTDKTIKSGVLYTYTIKAYNGKNIAEMTAQPAQVKYVAVPEFNVKNAANGIKITLTPVGGATNYVIEKEVNGVFTVIATLDSAQTTYIDTAVVGDTTYKYRVYAKSNDVSSFASASAQITRLGCPKITGIKNVLPGITITWTAVDDAVKYQIYKKTEYSSDWVYLTDTSDLSYTDGDVYSGGKYAYTINAVTDDGGYTGYDDAGKSIIFVETPDLVSVSNTNSGVSLKWEAVPGAVTYRVYRSTNGGSSWTLAGTSTSTTYIDKATLKGGTVYTYTVRAVNVNYSDFDADGISLVYLSTPQITGVSNTNGGINVTWKAVSGAVGYRVYRKTEGAKSWSYLGYVAKNSYKDTNVTNGKYFKYTVRAVNKNYSDFDAAGRNVKCVATPKLTGISNAAGGIYIKWNAVKGASQYRVYRRSAGSSTWTYLGYVKTTNYTDKTIANKNGSYYAYTVRAVNGGVYSGFESGLSIKRLSVPSLKSATSSKTGITVKWGTISGSSGYYVYRKTSGSSWSRIATVTGASKSSYVDKSAKKGVTYTYTVRAYSGNTLSSYNTKGISCKDRY